MNLAFVGSAARSRPAEIVAAGGWPAVITVAFAGLSAGFFSWYAFLMRGNHSALTVELSFATALIFGVVGALILWDAYAHYFARRTDCSFAEALHWDAVSWAGLMLLWLTLVAPTGENSGGRATAIAVGAFALAKVLIAARFNQTVRDVLVTFMVTRVSLIIIAELAAIIIGQRAGTHYAASQNPLLAVWGRWDAEHYIRIASVGYSGTEPAFFPLYPFLIRVLGAFTGNHLIAGLLISNVASFFGLLYFYKLCEHEYNRQVAHRATFYVSIFPTAIFFSAVYTESLFLFLTVASFYYIRERRWITAGIFGYFAALTRVEGVLLTVPFFIEWIIVVVAQRSELRRAFAGIVLKPIAGMLAIAAGLATYMGYLWVLRGDPLYFSHVQSHWGRSLAPPWVAFIHALRVITGAHTPQVIANQLLEVTFTVLMLGVLVIGFRRLRASYAAYMALSILIPMSTSSLMSMPRFALVLFPMFALFGLWGARASVNNTIVAFSMPLLGLFTVLFADWYWVA